MKRFILSLAVLLVLGLTGNSFAQGVQTGIIRGTVKDQQGLAIPSVKVTVTSTVLQGPRSATTDAQGLYVIRVLPAGDYHVTYELSGFTAVNLDANLPLGLTLVQDVTMATGAVTEQVEVVTQTPPPITTPVVGMNFRHDQIELLATPRTIQGIAQLAPALNENSPNAGQLVVNGAFAFDNVFMVNGVDVNDNLFATPQNLFIEDAIDETQVLTSGISAEFGRFSGGVVNAITKSGGNNFSGSARINFLNPNWTTQSPFEACTDTTVAVCTKPTTHTDLTSRIYEGTFGGPIMKDRVWFFASGRSQESQGQVVLPVSSASLPSLDTNRRGEIKVTGTVLAGHTVQGGFLNDPRTRTNNSGLQSFVIDPKSEADRSNPNWYYFTNYRGVLKNNMLVEAQFSQRHFKFENDGGTSTDILNSPILNLSNTQVYNAPYFDATDPENRNNFQVTGSVVNYWNLHGRHETKAGYEWYRSQRTGGNSQSSTSFVFSSDFFTNPDGTLPKDASGNPLFIPQFTPGESFLDHYPAIKGAELNVDNNSIFVQDHWTINGRWSADLGARFEHVKAKSTGEIVSINTSRIVPRLAVAWDVQGNGNHVVHFTYGQYSGRYNEAQIGQNSPVGNPADITSIYQGPACAGIGCAGFAPGFNVANYPVNSTNAAVSDPTQNVFMADGTKSPLTHEFTASYGMNLMKGRGFAEVSYIGRKTTNLIEDFQTLAGGSTNVKVSGVSAGIFTNKIYANTDLANRQYQAVVFISRYRIRNNWSINGHLTVQMKNDGNYEGEGTNTPGNTSLIGNYPEAFNAARSFPDGRLQDFQRARFRLWSVYDWNIGKYGDLTFSGLWRVESARVFTDAARNQPLSSTQNGILAAAGYPDLPQLQTVYFGGERGTQTFAGFGLLDTSINYNIPVFKSLKPWVKFDIYNLFDNDKLIGFNTTETQNKTTVDALGLGTTGTKGSSFGRASGNTVTNLFTSTINTFPLAFSGAPAGGRTVRLAIGFRF